jgi:glutaredoxin 3
MPTIVLYTSASCGYCVAAKNFLKNRGLDYSEVRVDLDPAQRAHMQALSGRSSVPQILIGETPVGGYDDLVALDRSGGLQTLLEASE